MAGAMWAVPLPPENFMIWKKNKSRQKADRKCRQAVPVCPRKNTGYSVRLISPQPIFVPESPAGCVEKSSLPEWITTDLPIISSKVKRLS